MLLFINFDLIASYLKVKKMKRYNNLFFIGLLVLGMSGCHKSNESTLPTISVTTDSVTNITQNTARSGGTVMDPGNTVFQRGVCWSTGPYPTILEGKTIDGNGNGSFTSSLTLYVPGTKYYLRAYAKNEYNTHYGQCLSFITTGTPGDTLTDIDGNVYHTISIGEQTWMMENLKTTKFSNGDPISYVTDGKTWSGLTAPAYCNMFGDTTVFHTYGRMYNGYAVKDSRGIAPVGWHVPSAVEWQSLIDFLGGNSVAGGKLKEGGFANWTTPNFGATNEYHFTGLPGGGRNAGYNGRFDGQFYNGYWWSSTETTLCLWVYSLYFESSSIGKQYLGLQNGFSVRCVKD